MQSLGIVEDGAIAVRDGMIAATGTTDDLRARFKDCREIDLTGFVVMPGLVDCHTHPVFAATREDEFHMRCAGADYMAIAQAGGGILSSMRAVRAASRDDLTDKATAHFEDFLAHGTTTLEAKSGYGLSTADELKSLEALQVAAAGFPLHVRSTFLGAHEFPPEYRENREGYVDLLVNEMLPAVAESKLATSCDVFAEPGVFDLAQSERVLSRAKDLGFRLRVHADEIQPMGGAEMAVGLGADSADHLGQISDAGIEAMANADTTAVFLPGTLFFLGKTAYPPARRMIEAGCAVALASDFNPGSSYNASLFTVITIACVQLHMTPEECVTAMTINPAASLGLDAEVGTLHDGKCADFIALDLPSVRSLGYAFRSNPVALTVVAGEPVVANLRDTDPSL